MSCAHVNHFILTTEMDSLLILNFAFPCGLHGFHVFKELWNPRLNEKLDTIHEENNQHDRYAAVQNLREVAKLKFH